MEASLVESKSREVSLVLAVSALVVKDSKAGKQACTIAIRRKDCFAGVVSLH
ncbi:MAG: hypothetical protein ACAF41_22260 [Leptolyngbya sp. BL-A-14]